MMTAQILDGRILSNKMIQDVKAQVDSLLLTGRRAPCLAMVLVGNDPASAVYVGNKKRQCVHAGITSRSYLLAADTSEEKLCQLLTDLNADEDVDGILVQLPLPKHIHTEKIIETIEPKKDVDGLHPYNIGRLALKHPQIHPCTPWGIMTMLDHANINIVGKDAIVVGASNIVGRPMALELLLGRATTTICHSKTTGLSDKVARADILIVGIGIPYFIKGEWIKEGAIVIDVGINRLENGKLCGDVEFNSAAKRASWITPVPGGVGPMTVATLMQNTLEVSIKHQEEQKTISGPPIL